MRSLSKISFVAAALMASTALGHAADLLPPPPMPEMPPEVVVSHGHSSGWYIRGDIGYADMHHQGVDYTQGALLTGQFEQHELDNTWFLQGGLGYQVTDYFRVDATITGFAGTDFDGDSAPAGSLCNGNFTTSTCDYDDNAALNSMTVLMANAYLDLGTFNGFTPYVGAGIGGAHVSYDTLLNDQTCTPSDPACDGFDFNHGGEDSWRFAWAVHAGASVDLTCNLKADAGYTFTRVEGGRMFGSGYNVDGSTPSPGFGGYGFDEGIDVHSGRLGLRYALGGGDCHGPAPVMEAPVVYK